jgi:hypothetical protein
VLSKLSSRLTYANVVASIALFIALGGTSYGLATGSIGSREIKSNSVRSEDIRNNDVRGNDIRNRTIKAKDVGKGALLADNFKAGQLPAGAAGAIGPRGPSFGDGWQVPNVNDVPCGTDTAVAAREISVGTDSRIWTFAQGTFVPETNDLNDVGLYVRLRDAANTSTFATSAPAWERANVPGPGDERLPLAAGGLLLAGANTDDTARPVLTVSPGTYRLELVAILAPGDPCGVGTARPNFGINQGSAFGYVLLGTG